MARIAKSLDTLRSQVNAAFPNRRKSSDGWIGDTAHSARKSDHNPDANGVVHALDITHAPESGFDSYAFSDMLIRNKDPRISYVISNGRIASGRNGPQPWVWRKYTGANKHDHHNHISVLSDPKYADDPAPWNLGGVPKVDPTLSKEFIPPPPTLRPGDKLTAVSELQRLLGCKITGVYDPAGETEWALRLFQIRNGLDDDGVCGPLTWAKLKGQK